MTNQERLDAVRAEMAALQATGDDITRQGQALQAELQGLAVKMERARGKEALLVEMLAAESPPTE